MIPRLGQEERGRTVANLLAGKGQVATEVGPGRDVEDGARESLGWKRASGSESEDGGARGFEEGTGRVSASGTAGRSTSKEKPGEEPARIWRAHFARAGEPHQKGKGSAPAGRRRKVRNDRRIGMCVHVREARVCPRMATER